MRSVRHFLVRGVPPLGHKLGLRTMCLTAQGDNNFSSEAVKLAPIPSLSNAGEQNCSLAREDVLRPFSRTYYQCVQGSMCMYICMYVYGYV